MEEFTRGMFFVDECQGWVSSELGGRGSGKRFNTEGTEVPQSSRRRRFNAEYAESAEDAEKSQRRGGKRVSDIGS